jgi:hypothetical protein
MQYYTTGHTAVLDRWPVTLNPQHFTAGFQKELRRASLTASDLYH